MNCPQCGNPSQPGEKFCRSCGTALPDNAPASPRYAGFWLRVAASFIDMFIAQGVLSLAMAPFGFATFFTMFSHGVPEDPNQFPVELFLTTWFVGMIITIVGTWLYYALFESSKWQATPGKKLLGLAVTDLSGNRISFGKATGRFFGRAVSSIILMIGYIMAGFTEKKQALHDIMAHTLVVRQ